MPVSYFGLKGTPLENLKRSFGDTPQMIEWLQNRVGNKLPWKKYYQIVAPGHGGAMENITLTSWSERFILDETYEKDWGLITKMVNIHELTHSFFGDAVVVRDVSHAWLKESWANYMEICYLDENVSKLDADYELYCSFQYYFGECKRYVRPIVCKQFDSSWNLFDGHLYPGGACRIHMLRKRLGEKIFWEAVQEYISTYSKKNG